ncbi:hypothetical protein L6164_035428 [Bauhinia variegata]|uniref:Uncharacterized protein n=1 Tax=Bauhinia variegata TaxID=167791 RepID=A0ACB9KE36_BAUVA|nr:hypothetical protein L6164_035428 [Bauhinia variegata]
MCLHALDNPVFFVTPAKSSKCFSPLFPRSSTRQLVKLSWLHSVRGKLLPVQTNCHRSHLTRAVRRIQEKLTHYFFSVSPVEVKGEKGAEEERERGVIASFYTALLL